MKHVEKSRYLRVYSTKRETVTILHKHRGSFGEDRSDELTSLEIIACKMYLHLRRRPSPSPTPAPAPDPDPIPVSTSKEMTSKRLGFHYSTNRNLRRVSLRHDSSFLKYIMIPSFSLSYRFYRVSCNSLSKVVGMEEYIRFGRRAVQSESFDLNFRRETCLFRKLALEY